MISTPDFTWLFIKMLAGLLLVLGLAFILIRVILPKTKMGRSRRNSWVSLIDRYPLDQHKSLYIVKIMERYFVLGSAENSINLVTELTQEEGEKIGNT